MIHPHSSRIVAVSALAAMALAASAAGASAQGLFDGLFGRRWSPPAATAYSDPYPQSGPFSPRLTEPAPREYSGGGLVSYCVRTCDGRFFPIQRSAASPVQVCSSFCPAARTKIFSGSGIDHAVAQDGTRYSDLPNAFAYRDKTVADCTCNGKDPYGLVNMSASDDPTLRPGDIVAGGNGMVAYTGGKRRNAEFTPIESYPGLSAELRRQLAGTKIEPADERAASAAALAPPAEPAETPRRSKGKRVQLER